MLQNKLFRYHTFLAFTWLLVLPVRSWAADADGGDLYKRHCGACHDASGGTRAPAPAALKLMSPENIVKTLESGVMKDQGASLSAIEKQKIAEFLTGKAIGAERVVTAGICKDADKDNKSWSASSPTVANWNGWGSDGANTRFQIAERAKLPADQVARLKLKWSFAFPDTFTANGQPVVVGGRIFVPGANRKIYSLDAKSGCRYWSIETEAPVRTALTIANVGGIVGRIDTARPFGFFGDRRGQAYAIDAATGQLIWKVRVDESNPRAAVVGALAYSNGVLFVPVTDAEEGSPLNPKYECCKGRGALVALDAATGKQIWKTYTITEEAHVTGKSKAGVTLWGPSGVSIWSAPTIDEERGLIYAGTGDNFSDPTTKMSDAIVAFDMKTGKIVWSKQLTENDAYNMGCHLASKEGCPATDGPDFDIGASPILVKLASGRRVLLVSQKSGIAHALDPDHNGAILWAFRVGRGGTLGGIQWGSASDGQNMYVANSDISWTKGEKEFERAASGNGLERRVVDPKIGGGLFAISVATGEKIWAAAPPVCGDQPQCSPAQSAAVSAIPGVVFSGSVDGHVRGYAMRDGKVIWDFDTAREFQTVNGLTAKGGSIDGPGPAIADGMVYVCSGYGSWGGKSGNVLLAFSIDGK
jgi:polyvinyl alcohol dehydrogenase (cytochrome)